MRISSLKAFHEHVGEVIMYCQRIEHDMKVIYAALETDSVYAGLKTSKSKTDVFRENYKKIESKSMGDILKKLKNLDAFNPYFYDFEYDWLENSKISAIIGRMKDTCNSSTAAKTMKRIFAYKRKNSKQISKRCSVLSSRSRMCVWKHCKISK